MKNLLITSLFLLLTAGTYGQSTTYQSDKPRGGIHKLLSKRAYTGQYPLPNFPRRHQALHVVDTTPWASL